MISWFLAVYLTLLSCHTANPPIVDVPAWSRRELESSFCSVISHSVDISTSRERRFTSRFWEQPKEMIEAELHVVGGKHSGQVIPLNRRKFLIGREGDCQLRPNSELVSRHHCVFGMD